MKLQILGQRVLVRRKEEMKVTKAGIIIPDSALEKPIEGEVVAVGPGKYAESGFFHNMRVGVGDTVLFAKFAGVVVDGTDKGGIEHIIMDQDARMAVIK